MRHCFAKQSQSAVVP